MEANKDITLSTGASIKHKREQNGSQFAWVDNRKNKEMTENEWEEYCNKIIKTD